MLVSRAIGLDKHAKDRSQDVSEREHPYDRVSNVEVFGEHLLARFELTLSQECQCADEDSHTP